MSSCSNLPSGCCLLIINLTPSSIGLESTYSWYPAWIKAMMTHEVWTTWEAGACTYWPVVQDYEKWDGKPEKKETIRVETKREKRWRRHRNSLQKSPPNRHLASVWKAKFASSHDLFTVTAVPSRETQRFQSEHRRVSERDSPRSKPWTVSSLSLEDITDSRRYDSTKERNRRRKRNVRFFEQLKGKVSRLIEKQATLLTRYPLLDSLILSWTSTTR